MILRMSYIGKNCHNLIWFSIFIMFKPTLSEILVFKVYSNETLEIIEDAPSIFGPSLPVAGFKGYVIMASPPEACVPPSPPPSNHSGPFIALVKRYNCSFVQKVLNAQYAGYSAVIVRNVGSNSVEIMSGDHDTQWVNIPSVFIGQDDGLLLEKKYQYNKFFVVITDDLPFNIQNYLLPFAITIGICFILMLTFLLVKCVRDYRQSRRHRLSSRALKKLPIHKFKKGDPYDCCAVCLEDYADNDKLRVLPCHHAYHSKCIDPWLTKNRRVCPVCKRKVIIGEEQPSDVDSGSEDESTPLINSQSGTQGGTFTVQRENPFEEAERAVERAVHDARRTNRKHTQYHQLDDSSDESFEGEAFPRLNPDSSEIQKDQTQYRELDDSSDEQDEDKTQPCLKPITKKISKGADARSLRSQTGEGSSSSVVKEEGSEVAIDFRMPNDSLGNVDAKETDFTA